ncbi:MarR family winged helix-turn-helix transcriptional regulator [Kribbella deserti]|uniref:MarR family winged helix-turn-helix transcriptional regulator n=1 Tax=Kribbella deserti TaxID=1926257 RepID=A0ABV6QL84_9ACTN
MSGPRWLTPAEMRAWLGYRRLRTLLDLQITRDLAADSGLSDADYDVLSTVSDADGRRMRVGELAAHMAWSVSRLSHHVSRMEQRGLVSRESSADDGRGFTVALTDEGWTTLQAAAVHHVESVRENFVDLLTPAELKSFATITEKLVAHLTIATPPTPPRATRQHR